MLIFKYIQIRYYNIIFTFYNAILIITLIYLQYTKAFVNEKLNLNQNIVR